MAVSRPKMPVASPAVGFTLENDLQIHISVVAFFILHGKYAGWAAAMVPCRPADGSDDHRLSKEV